MGLILKWSEMSEKMRHCSRASSVPRNAKKKCRLADLEVLNEVIEDAQALGVLAVLDIDQRADFRSLQGHESSIMSKHR